MMSKMGAGICALLLLAACGAPQTRQPQQGAGSGATPTFGPPGAAAYRIDPAQSEVRLLVYRAGPMARLGHNHVIVNRAVGGWMDAAHGAAGKSLLVEVPVADFVVDEAQARAAEGPEFAEAVTDDARAGTRRNMLGEALLDAARFSTITLRGMAVATPAGGQGQGTQAPTTWLATLNVQVAGHESNLKVPFTLETAAGRVTASGTAVLRQSDLGLTPVSVMLGALQVRDEFTVEFKLVAPQG